MTVLSLEKLKINYETEGYKKNMLFFLPIKYSIIALRQTTLITVCFKKLLGSWSMRQWVNSYRETTLMNSRHLDSVSNMKFGLRQWHLLSFLVSIHIPHFPALLHPLPLPRTEKVSLWKSYPCSHLLNLFMAFITVVVLPQTAFYHIK